MLLGAPAPDQLSMMSEPMSVRSGVSVAQLLHFNKTAQVV